MKKIFVTGGTGFLGSYLLRYLVQQGERNIRALKRETSDMTLVASIADKIEWVESDILDLMGLEEAMRGVNLVYHCAAVVSYDARERDWLYEVNVIGTQNIVNIALHLGIEKLLHVSSIAALGRTKGSTTLDETAEWKGEDGQSHYAISKHLAELEVWRGIAEGLSAAIINPSVILGAGFWKKGTAKLFLNAWKKFPFYPQGGTGFVDVRDVARAAILLMNSDIDSERFIINSANWSYKEQMFSMSNALNKKPPFIKVTPFIQEIAWRAATLQAFLLRRPAFVTKETARMSARRYYYDTSKSMEQLELTYTPIAQTIQETAKLLKAAAQENFQAKVLPLN